MVLLIDNFDSFTYNLVDYFNQLEIICEVKRNDTPLGEIRDHSYTALVMSPGPEIPTRAGNLMAILDHYHDKLPILGICLGHQAIGQYFGANVVKAERPMHGKISRILLKNDIIFQGLASEINVVRYNSLIIDHSNDCFKGIAFSENGEIMALKHNLLPIWGLQFHPEAALTENGLDILKNWISCNNIAV